MSFAYRALKAFADPTLPENYFRAQSNILRRLGIEMFKEESRSYAIYSKIILFVIVYSYTVFEGVELYFKWGQLIAMIDVFTYLFSHIGGMAKVTLLLYNRKKFRKMFRLFHAAPFAPDSSRGGNVEETYLRRIVKATEFQIIMYMGITSITLLSGAIRSTRSVFSPRGSRVFPFVPVTLLENTLYPVFVLGCLYQFLCVTCFAIIIITVDVLICSIIAHLSAQFKILNNAFRNLRERSKEMFVRDPGGRDEGECLRIILRGYIEHHCMVLRFAEELEELLNLLVLSTTSIDAVILCFLLYECTLYPLGSVPFMQNFAYYFIMVWKLSLYCYWGEEVTLQAANVAIAAGIADWPGAPLSMSKALVVVIARGQKPVYMTIGKFFPLSMDTLVKLLKGSFSYFTVMRQTRQ